MTEQKKRRKKRLVERVEFQLGRLQAVSSRYPRHQRERDERRLLDRLYEANVGL